MESENKIGNRVDGVRGVAECDVKCFLQKILQPSIEIPDVDRYIVRNGIVVLYEFRDDKKSEQGEHCRHQYVCDNQADYPFDIWCTLLPIDIPHDLAFGQGQ